MALDREERELFAAAVGQAVAQGVDGDDLDAGLDRLGWDDALAEDPEIAVGALFEAQGRACATSGALDRVLAAALGTSRGVVLPPLGSAAPPGRAAGDRIEVRGLGDGSIVVADDGLARPAGELQRRAVAGLDPAAGLVATSGSIPAGGGTPVPWAAAVAAGQRALAHELVGVSASMLELAREHALDRIQFGVPIASFQAVRHRLAETLVAIEAARAAVEAAWLEPGPVSASIAKAVAGRSARAAAKHCQQVLAGIGFTAEHPFHLRLRRVRVLDGLLGDARSLTRALGEQVLATGQLPPLLPL
jgi:hypothetical protein